VICAFGNKDVKPHPIAYESRKGSKDQLFVPTRHAHGGSKESEEVRSLFDHCIYSFSTNLVANHSRVSLHGELKRAKELEGDVEWKVVYGTKSVNDVLGGLKKSEIPLPKHHDGDLWKNTVLGLSENKDYIYNLL
jgi:hypothetical protein